MQFDWVPQRAAARKADTTIKNTMSSRAPPRAKAPSPSSRSSGSSPLSSAPESVQPSPDPPTATQQVATPLRTASKRTASVAAQKSIQQSYADSDASDAATAPFAFKKKRPSAARSQRPSSDASSSAPSSSTSTTPAVSHKRVPTKTASQQPSSKSSAPSAKQAPRRFQDDQNIVWELQLGACQQLRYKAWRRCVQCITKRAGDTCRFADFRAFPVDSLTNQVIPPDASPALGAAFLSSPDSDDVMVLPVSRPLDPAMLEQAQVNVASELLPVLVDELSHARQPNVLRRPRETTCRQMCEFCATSIFSASWFCRRCGREYCPDCKHSIAHPDDLDRTLAKSLLRCDQSQSHSLADLVPLTRFDEALLEQEVSAMRDMLRNVKPSDNGSDQATRASSANVDSVQPIGEAEAGVEVDINWKEVPFSQAGVTADRVVGRLNLRTFDGASFDTEIFRHEWAHGEPLLVRGVTDAMQHAWGPEALQARYGDDDCWIVRSDADKAEPKQVSVGDFFASFGKDQATKEASLGKGAWKLKDWPPSAEFKAEFPELYDDFNRIVPAPEYTTREGVLNLASCYPEAVIQPDLGPKMYNAWPGSEAPGGTGTTRLHMDMADAVNIMLYASPPTEEVVEEHRPGVAAWDIFRAEDADRLRAFLRKEHAHVDFKDDPIHIQRFFVDAEQRVKLFKQYGVRSWRIYQKQGEAVFIPAGCAHQVCNLADCIKVAVDFVSPQNVERCFRLTAEFRELVQDYKRAWKEDVLSLRTTLWYAWCTYRQMAGAGPNVWAEAKRKAKAVEDEKPQKITRRVLQSQ